MKILNHWGPSRKSGGYFYGDFRPYFRKERTASPNKKKGKFFFISKEKRVIFSFSRGTFYATLILMYETPKVEPGLGLPLTNIRINLLDFVVNVIDTNCFQSRR